MHNLPYQTIPFIGRDDELNELAHLLADPNCKLLTLVGPGGIGKTRLALEAARHFTAQDGIYFAALQPLDSSHLIVSAIAEALDFQFYQMGGDNQQQLLNYLREKSLLLVLDNFEHLLDGAGLLSDLLAHAPNVKIVATSREALNLKEEWLYPVKGMRFPQNDQMSNPQDYGAVRLFIQNARRTRTDFALEQEKAGVVRICALVEGMPLGIELAAAWVRALSCTEIADEIEHSLDILATSTSNVPERHRSLRAVLDHSSSRLSDAERSVFKKCSVFRGGFTRQAAQAVTGSSLSTLSALVDKSFLRHVPNGRYNIHELLRQYGAEQLSLSPEEDAATHDQHCRFYTEFMQQREVHLKGRLQSAACNEIEADFENVRTACQWALWQKNYDALGMASESLFHFCEMGGRFQEGREFLWLAQQQLAAEGDDLLPLWARIMCFCLWLWMRSGYNYEESRDSIIRLEDSLVMLRENGDKAVLGWCLCTLGVQGPYIRDRHKATGYMKESLALFTELDDRFYMARAADWLGVVYTGADKHEVYAKLSQQSLNLRMAIGDNFGAGSSLFNLAGIALELGHYQQAKRYSEELGRIYEEIGRRGWTERRSALLSRIGFQEGDFQEAQRLADKALEMAPPSGAAITESKTMVYTVLGLLAALEEDYAQCWKLCERADLSRGLRLPTTQTGLALAACGLEDYPSARHYFLIAHKEALKEHWPVTIANQLPVAAILLAHDGKPQQAAELLGLALNHPASAKVWMEQLPLLRRLRTKLKNELGAKIYTAAWERGKSSDLETAAAAILQHFPADPSSQAGLIDPLTEREREVLHLLAAGHSNRQIAETLVLALGTVKWYINQIYEKLDVTNRTQAAARARELNLLS